MGNSVRCAEAQHSKSDYPQELIRLVLQPAIQLQFRKAGEPSIEPLDEVRMGLGSNGSEMDGLAPRNRPLR